jgi:polysaccharide pyruvyl transferase WcaK-like protein
MGVGALTAGVVTAAVSFDPDGEVFLLDYGRKAERKTLTVGGRSVGVGLVNMRFSKKFYLPNNISVLLLLAALCRMIPFPELRRMIVERSPWLKEIERADIHAAISGGDSFSDIYGLGRLLYVSLPQILVLLMKKPLVLLPQTLGPFKGWFARHLAEWIIRGSVVTYSRDWDGVKEWNDRLTKGEKPRKSIHWRIDQESSNVIPCSKTKKDSSGSEGFRNLLPPTPYPQSSKVRFCYDVGFVVEPRRPEVMDLGGLAGPREAGGCLVGLNVSGLLYMGGYTKNNMFGLKADYRELMVRLIDYLVREKHATVLLVPHVFGSEEHGESDVVACQKVLDQAAHEQRRKVCLVNGRYDQSEIKYIIGLCDFFIGSRMHACIAALSQCIPAVGIAYSRKFRGVMESIGAGHLVADPRSTDVEGVIGVVDAAWENRDAIRGHLEKQMPLVKERVLGLFEEIGEITGLVRRGPT